MAGHEQRHQLVAQLLVGHRRAVLVARREQHRRARRRAPPSLGAALVDQLEDQRVGLLAQAHEARPRPAPAERPAAGTAASRSGVLPISRISRQALAQRRRAAGPGRARTRRAGSPRASAPGAAGAARPARRAASSRPRARPPRRIRPESRCIFSPWKAGSISLRCSRCASLVEQDHRVAADDRLEDARALAGVQHLGRRREDLLDLVGVGEHHERRRRRAAGS